METRLLLDDATTARLARRYCWDMDPETATARQVDVVRRVMDFGDLDDTVALEQALGRQALVAVIAEAPRGSFRPRSLAFWRVRLGLPEDFAASAERQPLR